MSQEYKEIKSNLLAFIWNVSKQDDNTRLSSNCTQAYQAFPIEAYTEEHFYKCRKLRSSPNLNRTLSSLQSYNWFSWTLSFLSPFHSTGNFCFTLFYKFIFILYIWNCSSATGLVQDVSTPLNPTIFKVVFLYFLVGAVTQVMEWFLSL